MASWSAIEPEPNARAILEAHIALNDCIQRSSLQLCHLVGSPGVEELHISPSCNRGKHSLQRSNVTLGLNEPSPGSTKVSTQTLDEHHEDAAPLAGPSKETNVEGAELLVIDAGVSFCPRENSPVVLFEASELLTGPLRLFHDGYQGPPQSALVMTSFVTARLS